LLAAALLSFILYQLNMVFFFCVPLQILLIRKDEKNFLYGCASVFATIVITAMIRIAPAESAVLKRGILAMEIALPAFFIAGLIAVNLPWKVRLRTLYRVLAVTLGAGMVSIPLVYLLGRNEGFSPFLRAQIQSVAGLLQPGAEESGALAFDIDALTAYVVRMLLRNYLFVYFIIIAGSVWAGRRIAARMAGEGAAGLRSLHVSDWLIWPLLVSWALVLVDFWVGTGAVGHAAWNIGSIMLFVYGMQGIGIMQAFLDRRNVPRHLRILLGAGMAAMIFLPGVNLVILVGLPVLGVLELWIHFRKRQEE